MDRTQCMCSSENLKKNVSSALTFFPPQVGECWPPAWVLVRCPAKPDVEPGLPEAATALGRAGNYGAVQEGITQGQGVPLRRAVVQSPQQSVLLGMYLEGSELHPVL